MKRIVLLIALISLVCSCDNWKYYDLNRVVLDDYVFLKAYHQGVTFYESQGELNKSIIKSQSLRVLSVKNVFRVDSTLLIITHPKGASSVYESHAIELHESWIKDYPSAIDYEYDLEDILDLIESMPEIELPDTKIVALRRPLIIPEPINLQYVFGDEDSGYMWVDSKTQKIEYHEICR